MHSRTPISVVQETPAHIANRHETQTLTNLNTDTGKIESHEIQSTVPIFGNIQEVKTVFKNDVRSYDLETKRFGPIRTQITPQ
jgi:hypothetical protein